MIINDNFIYSIWKVKTISQGYEIGRRFELRDFSFCVFNVFLMPNWLGFYIDFVKMSKGGPKMKVTT